MALGRSPEYHWNHIISKSVHQFSRRSCLKLLSIYSPGGHFCSCSPESADIRYGLSCIISCHSAYQQVCSQKLIQLSSVLLLILTNKGAKFFL